MLGRSAALLLVTLLVLAFIWLLYNQTVTPTDGRTGEVGSELAPLSFYEERAAVLFGVATVALTMITLLLAAISIFGWASIRDKVEYEVERHLTEQVKRIDVGLTRLGQSEFYITLYEQTKLETDEQKKTFAEDLYAGALHYAGRAAKDLVGTDHQTLVDNNLAYLLALRGEQRDADQALSLIQRARRMDSQNSEIIITYAQVIAAFHDELAIRYPQNRFRESAQRLLDELDQKELSRLQLQATEDLREKLKSLPKIDESESTVLRVARQIDRALGMLKTKED